MDITVSAYRISYCDYVDESSGAQIAALAPIMSDFIAWIGGLSSVGESVTYEPMEDDAFLRTFCLDARPVPGTSAYLVATWNEDHNDEDTVQLISVDAPIGSVAVSHLPIDPRSTPGYPAYFVVIPDRNLLLNLRFEHRLNGSQPFKRYLQGFMMEAASYCVWDQTDDTKLLGYADIGQPMLSGSAFVPRFTYHLLRRPGDITWIRSQSSNIRKVIRRAVIYPREQEHKAFFEGLLALIGQPPNKRLSAGVNVEYELKRRFTPDQLDRAIEQYGSADPDDAWNDIGFVMAKESSKINWLSGGYVREKVRFDAPRSSDGAINIEQLAIALGERWLQRFLDAAT